MQHLKEQANNAFGSINRADISELKAEFSGNFETIRPLFESICLLLDEPTNAASLKRVIFDAGFKSRLSRALFKKCSDALLEDIRKRL